MVGFAKASVEFGRVSFLLSVKAHFRSRLQLGFCALLLSLPAFGTTGSSIPLSLRPYLEVGLSKQVVFDRFEHEVPRKIFRKGLNWNNPFVCNPQMHFSEFNRTQNTEILKAPRGDFFFAFGAVTVPVSDGCKLEAGLNIRGTLGTGRLIGVFDDLNSALEAIDAQAIKEGMGSGTDAPENLQPKPSAPPATNDEPKDLEREPRQTDNSTYAVSFGTGFFVSPHGHLVTNEHVVRECNQLEITVVGLNHPARLLAEDKVNDVALLKTALKDTAYLPVGTAEPTLMEEIFVAGYPYGNAISSTLKVTRGIVSSLAGARNNYSKIQIDAAIQPGNSGGPIVNEYGEPVAMAVAKLDARFALNNFGAIPEGVNFGIRSSVVKSLLDANDVVSEGHMRNPNLSTQQLAKLLKKTTVLITCKAD